ncbi:MAG TPA: tetratricopeptide repeat protein [Polyangiaceae bacterium]|nr:tetratricopeptide repeat protein [Polyangiaceae bacterium]
MKDLSRDARALLERTRPTHEPKPEDRARVRRALASHAAGAAAATSLVGHAKAAAGGAGAAKAASVPAAVLPWLLGGVIAGSASAGYFRLASPSLSETQPGVAASSSRASANPERRDERGSERSARPVDLEPAPGGVTEGLISPFSAGSTASAPPPLRAPERGVALVGSKDTEAHRPALPPNNAVVPPHMDLGAPGSQGGTPTTGLTAGESQSGSVAGPGAVASVSAGSDLSEEARALAEAQRALSRGAPRVALSLLAEQSQAFPTGALREERAAARIFALCASGDAARARSEAARFLRNSPHSPLAARVRAACAKP